MAEKRVHRRLAAILAADVVGYSSLMERDETGTLARLRSLRTEVFDPGTKRFDGRIFKNTGDGALAEFGSAVDAVQCAIEIQRALAQRNTNLPDELRVTLRIGISLGDVIVEDGDLYGNGVNIAARLEGLAEPGGICVSGNVYEHVANEPDVIFEDLGEQAVKNLDRPVRSYRVQLERAAESRVVERHDAPPSIPDKPSIAVLPFQNMSGDPEQEYFADGITEDLITALSRIRSFFVIARNTMFTYKGQAVNIPVIAEELGVRYLLEGSVRKAGTRLRITVQLIEGSSGRNIWAEKYDRDLEDIFAVQDEITRTVVGAMEPELAEAEWERARSLPTGNMAVWDLYQRGMAFVWTRHGQGQRENLRLGMEMFEKVLDLDPEFSPAYAGLAFCYYLSLILGHFDDPGAQAEKALAIGRRAVALASDDHWAHFGLGMVHMARRESDLAIQHLQTAIDLNPSAARAHNHLGASLIYVGRAEEALPHLEMSLRLSPRDPIVGPLYVRFAEAYLQLGDEEKSVEWSTRALARPETQFWGNCVQTSALGRLGRLDQAKAALDELIRRRPDISIGFVKKHLPITDERFLETYLDGLRKAGVPE